MCSQRTYVRYTREARGSQTETRREFDFNGTQSSKNGSKSKTQAKRATTEAKKSAAETAKATKRAAAKTAVAEKNQVQTVAETAVDLPVGVVLSVSDRVTDLVEPWTGRTSAEKQLKSLPHPAAQNAETDRASRHQRPPQGDHRGPQDAQPGRA